MCGLGPEEGVLVPVGGRGREALPGGGRWAGALPCRGLQGDCALSPRKECLVSSSGNDNTENGLAGSKAEQKVTPKA